MSRTATLHSSTRSAVAARLDQWGEQTHRLEALQRDVEAKAETLRQTQSQTVEGLAQALLPVATAMARLTEETRRTLERIEERAEEERRQVAQRHAEHVAKAQEVADRLAAATSRAEETMRALTQAMGQARDAQPNPWGPALLLALPSLLALGLLVWRGH